MQSDHSQNQTSSFHSLQFFQQQKDQQQYQLQQNQKLDLSDLQSPLQSHNYQSLNHQSNHNNIIFRNKLNKVIPLAIQILLPSIGVTQIQLGNCRLLQVLFYNKTQNNDRNSLLYQTVTQKQIKWTTNPSNIVSIDIYGTLKTINTGFVQITVQSLANPSAKDTKRISVTNPDHKLPKITKINIQNYSGKPVDQILNWQKIVQRYVHSEALKSTKIPQNIKQMIFKNQRKIKVSKGDVTWTIQNFADGSGGKYVKRLDSSLSQNSKDRVQYFMGDRYLPDDGKSPHSIQLDQQNGIFVIGQSGNINNIKLFKLGYADKAIQMSKNTEQYVSRYGMASNSDWVNGRWVSSIDDNDGLWTSMYGVGQLMRYSVLKKSRCSSNLIKDARKSALKSLKAVLMISNVSGRDGTIQGNIRYLLNTRLGTGYWYSSQCLKKDKYYMTDCYVGSPNQGISFYGIDAGKTTQGHYVGGQLKYTMQPIQSNDWVKFPNNQKIKPDDLAKTSRTVKGYISRSFGIKDLDPLRGGVMIQRNSDGTQTILSGAKTLYDFNEQSNITLNVGNIPIPQVLKDVLFINGKQYTEKDLIYKADASNDEIIGHLVIYKVAFDILDQKDPQQKALKDLIVKTITNYGQHLLDNGYTLVDATGYGTKWGKTSREFLNSDASIQQGNMQAMILLLTFKLAFYMTNEMRWQDQYLFLVNHKALKYLDFATTYWQHWMYMIMNQDNKPEENIYRLKKQDNPSQIQKITHAMYSVNYSDQQMAMLIFYLCFQLQTDSQLLKKYQKALDAWWISVSRGQYPLWYFIYQLSKPNQQINDAFGNNILDTATWHLSRHPISTVRYQAFIDGSRADVFRDNQNSVNPDKIIGRRTSKSDIQNASNPYNFKINPKYDPANIYQIKVLPGDERALHKFNGSAFREIQMKASSVQEPSTTYTLPYWLGVYHEMLKFNAPSGIELQTNCL